MRVTIEIKEKQDEVPREPSFFNLFKGPNIVTYWNVETSIELTEEERAILNARKLWDLKLYDHQLSDEFFSSMTPRERRLLGTTVRTASVTIKDLFAEQPHLTCCYSRPEAQAVARNMETEYLPRLKTLILTSADETKPKTFEL
jgi:hypothetical protein